MDHEVLWSEINRDCTYDYVQSQYVLRDNWSALHAHARLEATLDVVGRYLRFIHRKKSGKFSAHAIVWGGIQSLGNLYWLQLLAEKYSSVSSISPRIELDYVLSNHVQLQFNR